MLGSKAIRGRAMMLVQRTQRATRGCAKASGGLDLGTSRGGSDENLGPHHRNQRILSGLM
ncbi:hypothetical protein XH93_21835 [Bradyrhizobium sp. CCBAU 51753]|nr:hypothetical protein XH93_21835 [Bradyrhizobium sp. CCBAU 51753]